jgi:DNA-binding PadR family transcriptional regulator
MSWRRTNPLALAVLVTLFDAPRHPYEIARTLKQRHHHETMRLNFGSLYGVVNALEREGFIEILETERAGNRPERTIYALTEAGAGEAIDWLSELVSMPVKEHLRFEAALTLLAALAPDEAERLLEIRRHALEQRLAADSARLDAVQRESGLPRLFLLEAEYDLALLRAETEFVGALVAELRDGTFPDVEEWRRWSRSIPAAGAGAVDHHAGNPAEP